MLTLSLVLAAVAAAVHVLFFLLESVLFMREDVHRRFLIRSREEAQAQRLLALNQGFYNLFLAAGCVAGIVLAAGSDLGIRWALLVFSCLFMVGAAVVLAVSERRLAAAAAVQGIPPALALMLLVSAA